MARELVIEGDKFKKTRGAPSQSLVINPDGAYSVGLDFNRDHLTGILVDLGGNVKGKIFYEIDTPSPKEAISLMSDTIRQLLGSRKTYESRICGAGVAFPGPMQIKDNSSVLNIVNPKAFPGWNEVPVVDMLASEVGLPVYLENNASAAALGERWYGLGRNISTFLYTFFGAGLGGGLIINGELHEGSSGNAGELGYFPMSDSQSMLSDSAQPHIGEHFNLSKLFKWLNQNGQKASQPAHLEALLQSKNSHFMEWMALAEEILTPMFQSVEYLFDPEVIVLGGRLPASINEHLRTNLSARLKELRIRGKSSGPDIICSTAGVDAAALGAATLPMFDLFAAQPTVLIKKNGNR